MESIGIVENEIQSDEQIVIERFHVETLKFEDGRYHISRVWKEGNPGVPANELLCDLKDILLE